MVLALTQRVEQILHLIADGFTNREISGYVSISESTVENHIHHVYDKSGISRRAQAVAYAFRIRVIQFNQMLQNRS